jgi:Isoprenylcysteine carboxyl methyltransferase (ICMT) family
MAATAAYFGLAVLGWAGPAAFLSHPSLIALAVALFAMAGATLFVGGSISPGEREDRGNRWVLAVGCSPPTCPLGRTARSSGHSTATPSDGSALRSSRPAGRYGSGPSSCSEIIQPGHTLVTSGVYGVIRHPSYLGCSSTRLGGCSPFGREWASCSRPSLSRRSSRALARKRGCCTRSLALSTRLTGPGHCG